MQPHNGKLSMIGSWCQMDQILPCASGLAEDAVLTQAHVQRCISVLVSNAASKEPSRSKTGFTAGSSDIDKLNTPVGMPWALRQL